MKAGEFSCVLSIVNLSQIEITCHNCFNKMNKVKNFDMELNAKIAKANEAKDSVVKTLMEMPGVKMAQLSTPGNFICFLFI